MRKIIYKFTIQQNRNACANFRYNFSGLTPQLIFSTNIENNKI